jgi:hypothetical protein
MTLFLASFTTSLSRPESENVQIISRITREIDFKLRLTEYNLELFRSGETTCLVLLPVVLFLLLMHNHLGRDLIMTVTGVMNGHWMTRLQGVVIHRGSVDIHEGQVPMVTECLMMAAPVARDYEAAATKGHKSAIEMIRQ